MTVIDADSHLYETRDLWTRYAPSAQRGSCLTIEDDALGYAWLTHRGRRIEALGVHGAGDVSQSGEFRRAMRDGDAADVSYDDMPPSYWSASDRIATLDAFGIDETILFPNCGIMWERILADDLPATLTNMAAWNRSALDVFSEGGGRLHPVAHVTLRDIDWLVGELRILAAGGIRTAMIAPSLVDGRRLSHPDHERAWAAFAEYRIAPIFHIAQYVPAFDDAWNEGDPDWSNPVLSSVFMWTAPALALADLAIRGVLMRHPDLRIGVVELMSSWLPLFLLQLDGGFGFHAAFNGAPLTEMEKKPSEYIRDCVKVASFAFENPGALSTMAGDMFMFGSDWPHPEGAADPIGDFVRGCGLSPESDASFYSANAGWLLGRN